jgi:uncharacterized protein DUF4118
LNGTRTKPRECRTRRAWVGVRPMRFGTTTPGGVVGGVVAGTVIGGKVVALVVVEVVVGELASRLSGVAGVPAQAASTHPATRIPSPAAIRTVWRIPSSLLAKRVPGVSVARLGFRDCIRRARISPVSGLRALFESRRTVIARVCAVVLPVGLAALLVPFRATFAATAAALLLVAVIVAVAAVGDRTAGYLATVAATLSFDFFLTQPYGRLQITHRADLETAICLFLVGVVVTEIVMQSKRFHHSAREQSEFVDLIHTVSELVTSGASRADVVNLVSDELVSLLHLRACYYETGNAARARMRIERNGDVLLGGRLWGAHELGLPGSEVELPVHDRGLVVGRFVLVPTPARPVSQQRRVVAVALSDQVGAVLRPHLRTA